LSIGAVAKNVSTSSVSLQILVELSKVVRRISACLLVAGSV